MRWRITEIKCEKICAQFLLYIYYNLNIRTIQKPQMRSNLSFLTLLAPPYSQTELSLVCRRRHVGLDWCLFTPHFFFRLSWLLSSVSLSLVLLSRLLLVLSLRWRDPPAWDPSAYSLTHREIPGWDHFIVLFRSLSFTLKASVTFFPLRPSPPFL